MITKRVGLHTMRPGKLSIENHATVTAVKYLWFLGKNFLFDNV